MKKNKFLLLLVALFVLTAAIPAQAGTVSTQYLNTLTGHEFFGKTIPTSGSYGRVATTADAGTFSVVDDGTGNYAYQFLGGATAKKAMTIYTYANLAGTNSGIDETMLKSQLQKMTARIRFSDATGETNLFSLSKVWGIGPTTDTGGVTVRNGGAYYWDMNSQEYVSFIQDGALQENVWYTVEVIYDFRNPGNYMCATVYDESGIAVGASEWAYVSDYPRYEVSKNYPHLRTLICFSNFPIGSDVMIDDVALYTLTFDDTAVTCTDFAVAQDYSSASLTFSDELEAGLITKDNVTLTCANPNFDVSDKYEVSYANGVVTLTLDSLPYSEDFTITVTTKVRPAGDIFGIPEAITKTFTTPEDPFKTALENLSFASSGNEVVATTTLDNSISTSRREYMFVVTSWNNSNECVAIRNLHGFVDGGQSPNITLPAVPFEGEGSRVYVSLLDNWYNLIPVGDARVFQLGGN